MDAIQKVVTHLSRLPGVGEKTAKRLALSLFGFSPGFVESLATAMVEMRTKMHPCPVCRCLTDREQCRFCSSPERDRACLCVVASIQDLMAIELTGAYSGLYHVLDGHLAPLDGRGPKEIGVPLLMARLTQGNDPLKEVILATGTTIDGEATAQYLQKLLASLDVSVTRIASGVPMGGSLEYADSATLGKALIGRRKL